MNVRREVDAGPWATGLGWFALCCGLLLASASCERWTGCGQRQQAQMAVLTEVHGAGVQRDHADRQGGWQRAAVGASFALGDGIRTQAGGMAVLQLSDGARLRVEPGTALRFLVSGAGGDEQMLDVTMGEAVLKSGAHSLRLRTHVGLAVLAPGSEVQLSRSDAGLQYHVEIGELRFNDAAGQPVALHSGDSIRVGIGMAVIRDAPLVLDQTSKPTAASSTTEPAASAVGAAAAVAGGEFAPSYSNLGVTAGDSFSVHAAELPVAIHFDFGARCPELGELQLGEQRVRASGSVNVSLGPGSRSYALRCLDARGRLLGKVVAGGSVRVLRDAGTQTLPPRAPTSRVDADGRSYTVYFQNQLPEVHVRWPNAPRSTSYQLELDGKASALAQPEKTLPSGSLREGAHTLTFRSGERRSRTTTVNIRFDNAAPKASLRAPKDRGFAAGDTVRVEGVALPTWKVSVDGGTISRDDSDRFSGEVVTSPGRPDIAVCLRHPRLGTHYYLRRATGSP